MLLSLQISVVAYTGQTYYAKNLQVEVKADPSEDSKTKFIIAMGRKVIELNNSCYAARAHFSQFLKRGLIGTNQQFVFNGKMI